MSLVPAKNILYGTNGLFVISIPPVNIPTNVKWVNVDTTGARTLVLPDPSTLFCFTMKDVSGQAWTRPITLSRGLGTYLINGVAADYKCVVPYGGWQVYSNGTNVRVVGPNIDTIIGDKGLPIQTEPVNMIIAGGQYGREFSGALEVSVLDSLIGNVKKGNRIGWYNNYNPTTDIVTPNEAFTPLFFTHSMVTSPNLTAASAYPIVFGFNEPDNSAIYGGGMTVAQALSDWQLIEAACPNSLLASPSCIADMSLTSGTWFSDFMNGVGASPPSYRPRIDYIAIHQYTANFSDSTATGLLNYIDAVHTAWGKKIYVTEYGMIGFAGGSTPPLWTYPTQAQVNAFLPNAVGGMRARAAYCIGGAWYPTCLSASALATLPANGANIPLANPDGSLTTTGALYASF